VVAVVEEVAHQPGVHPVLAPVRAAQDPLIRLRAQFTLWVAQRPEQRINRVTWRRWLAADPVR
jgi:hypothetical protein